MFLDGTWNWIANNTNVWRMKSLCVNADTHGVPQATYYDVGVNGLIGGLVAKGLELNIIEAYKWVIEEYEPGAEIYIFGFSRGAFTARSLAGLITMCGLPKLGAPLGIEQIYDRYKRTTEDNTIYDLCRMRDAGEIDEKTCSLEDRWMLRYSQLVDIKMVGVWDTVGKVGVPFGEIRNFSSKAFRYLHTGLRKPMLNCLHAIAIDEHRRAFPPTLWTIRKPHNPNQQMAPMRPIATCEQRWFVGAHGNIGGGYASDVLAQLPFRWLLHKAAKLGLEFRNEAELDGELAAASVIDSYKDFAWGAYSLVSRRTYREIDAPPSVDEKGTHIHVNETVDRSVFDYWRTGSYNSPIVEKWVKKKGVDPTAIKTSVRADDPNVAVSD
ncbi:MAG: DUF2235 domain-containing protein [Methyloceanibacter sp.]